PCLVHVITRKGYGYAPAEQSPAQFHGIGAFDPESGEPKSPGRDFSSVFGDALTELGKGDPRVTAITAAMTEGTGLTRFFRELPRQAFDVGIAEEHACAMAAGMASQGLIPVFAAYSTFLQRSYDMLIHDVSLMGLHVVLAVDRAGIVGRDGQTHQGLFDVSYLSDVPGMTIYAPSSFRELRSMLRRAVLDDTGPTAIRYPRGGEGTYTDDVSDAPCAVLREGSDLTIVSYGIEINEALAAAELLAQNGVSAEVVKLNRLAPLDLAVPRASVEKTGRLMTAEDVCRAGSMGEKLLAALAENGISVRSVRRVDLGDGILANGSPEALRARTGLDGAGLARAAREMLDAEAET
ncbi:MAG: 1-deoxy-D-xylulose-5-phosphate synthase, partial [Oscillospiraceae bacterium]|nr:1-deoxy-D-xylulose-5-phosphate synthase [Oscillospiraceae bacterium]